MLNGALNTETSVLHNINHNTTYLAQTIAALPIVYVLDISTANLLILWRHLSTELRNI